MYRLNPFLAILIVEALSFKRKKSKTQRQRSMNYRYSSWPHGFLLSRIKYIGSLYGVEVRDINAAYTSKVCNQCFHIGRRDSKIFRCLNPNCRSYGSLVDADVNAAKNILAKYLCTFKMLSLSIKKPDDHLHVSDSSCISNYYLSEISTENKL